MHITRLRLVGFKSFVEPAELLVSSGLTGVVGPNGCGKSNLLEALRWVMGESSHKSMRAAAMDDVIFNGTTLRPARNSAEVTIFIDNADRNAPPEFNGADTLEVTRRIEREAGSAFRINGREARARDVRILFEDAATGARSPALVRQGQIGELVNAKPEQRRRILEDAAGIAGLHSRRHEAELRLRAAEGNLARLRDILDQLGAQIESLKRQARQARRYREVSAEIRKLEALLLHLRWAEAQAAVEREEGALAAQLRSVGEATEEEGKALRAEADTAGGLQPLREKEAEKGAVLARFASEREAVEREAERTQDRQTELEDRLAQLTRDLAREQSLIAEAQDSLQRIAAERAALADTAQLAAGFEQQALKACDEAEGTLQAAELRLGELTSAAAEARARQGGLLRQREERQQQIHRLQRQLVALDTQTREIVGRAPDASKLKSTAERGQQLLAGIADVEAKTLALEEALRVGAGEARARSDAAAAATLAAGRAATEVATLVKVLTPAGSGLPPVLDEVTAEPGYELALAAALGEDLEAPASEDAPVHWRQSGAGRGDPPLPSGAEALSSYVTGPLVLARRLAQIGVVAAAEGALLQPLLRAGQRLVSPEGHLWRWDGFVVQAHVSATAANRLAERNRLAALKVQEAELRGAADAAHAVAANAAKSLAAAEDEQRRLRQAWREAQAELAGTRDALTAMEQQARETEVRMAAVFEAKSRAQDVLAETHTALDETEQALRTLPDIAKLEGELAAAQKSAGKLRLTVSERRTELIALEREHRSRSERAAAIVVEAERWQARAKGAEAQIAALQERTAQAAAERTRLAPVPAALADKRQKLLDMLVAAEGERRAAADRLAAAEAAHRQAVQAVRAAQAAVADAREARARLEAQLEGARTRRGEAVHQIREQMGCSAEQCLALAEPADDAAALPSLADADHQAAKLKADRERLGGVNLQAEEDLGRLEAQFEGMEGERSDVEAAIAKLRSAIAQINAEGRQRLQGAFDSVNGHFQSLFTTLFGGGEARLAMIDAEDPLEGGLEIIAKPPGKKPATLSLLSGGEQSLTALALIFAVFLTNPSPICVLDEVDAPLDDANVDRFCTLMEKMAHDTETRFLVITHHPMTMSRMSRLFGVTMGEQGVSQLVSVDLETAQKFTVAA